MQQNGVPEPGSPGSSVRHVTRQGGKSAVQETQCQQANGKGGTQCVIQVKGQV